MTSRLDADLLLLQERRKVDAGEEEHWCGDLPFKGLSVTAAGCEVVPLVCEDPVARFFVPYQVAAAEPFQLIHVWSQEDGADRYIRGVVRSVRLWRERIASQPTVIAGDFNANACWDAEHPRDRNFSALVALLRECGLVSAYHTFFNEAPGAETRPTFYWRRHTYEPFHLDYCFIPEAWVGRLRRVSVGEHAEWGGFSDHMPVTVELG